MWRRAHGVAESLGGEVDPNNEDSALFVAGSKEVERLASEWLNAPKEQVQVHLATDSLMGVLDFMIPESGGHRLIEVKASSESKFIHYHDLAFQWILAERAGFPVTAAEVLHLNRDYVFPGGTIDFDQLLVRVEVTEEVRSLLLSTSDAIDELSSIVVGKEPVRIPALSCRGNRNSKKEVRPSTCGHLEKGGLCRQSLPNAWVGDVPRVNAERFRALCPKEARSVSDLSADDLQLLPQSAGLIVQAWVEGREVWVREVAREFVDSIKWPVAFLDFEFEPAIPIPRFPGMRPNQVLPFQWAMSVQAAPGDSLISVPSFLHESEDDPREPFIESLIDSLPLDGDIVVFHQPAESGVLRQYQDWLGGKFAPSCSSIIDRLVDLLPAVRSCYASPALNGSYSLKAVAPAMTGIGYEGMAVSSGLVAVAQWRNLLVAQSSERESLRSSLLDYCSRDAALMSGILQRMRVESN